MTAHDSKYLKFCAVIDRAYNRFPNTR